MICKIFMQNTKENTSKVLAKNAEKDCLALPRTQTEERGVKHKITAVVDAPVAHTVEMFCMIILLIFSFIIVYFYSIIF
ncbi:MAG: hypothetical protein J6B71_09940, partial [Clostridia bacterium]|nr:hypothetical protein [Clostridia bacterium]